MIDLRVLGRLEVRDGASEPVDSVLTHPKQTALFVYLALAAPRTFARREHLLGLFWPDADDKRARASLKQAVYALRQGLGSEVISTRGDDEIGLDAACVECDVWTFDAAVGAGDLEDAADAYGGPLPSGFGLRGCVEFEHWADRERDRLARSYTDVLERLVDRATEDNDTDAAVRWARQLAAHRPHSTRVALRVMEVLESVGDRAGALEQAARHAALMRDDLEAEPSPDVMAYAKRLRERPVAHQSPPRAVAAVGTKQVQQLARLREALAERYVIERELGAGGMATVYLAEDLKHHRKVAVKVLRPELTAALGPERFLREIEVAANLTHPHILPLFDSGEAGGFLYYAMPYIEGPSLRDKLVHEGELPVQDAVKILREVVDALAHAHEHGVVHRDIKPDNVLLSGRHALVVDFGVAKAITQATGAEVLTTKGIALGTPTYMAPEQAAAEEHIDQRADIYAVGVLAYEMLAGRPPFAGTTSQMVLAAHLTEAPEPVTKYRQAVPPALAQLVMKCLEKKPADRWQRAEELLSQLDALGTSGGSLTPAKTKRRTARTNRVTGVAAALIAIGLLVIGIGLRGPSESTTLLDPDAVVVLPFRVGGDRSSVGYLREGIPELLYTRLTGEAGPRAVEPGTVLSAWRRAVADEADDLPTDASLQLAQGLGAGQLLLGAAVGTPTSLMLSGTLMSVSGGKELAQASAAGSPDSLAVLIDRLVAELLVEQAGEGTDRLEALTSTSPVALRAYLAGQRAVRRGLFQEAVGHFGEALDTDSLFALAALGLRRATDAWGLFAPAAASRGTQRAWELRGRLSARDRVLLNAYVGPNYPRQFSHGERLIVREAAVDVAPDHAEVWYLLGRILKFRGRFLGLPDWQERAAAAFDRALALDSAMYRVIEDRIQLAILAADTALVRRLASLFFRTSPDGVRSDYVRWHVAQALSDTAALSQLRARSMEWGVTINVNWIGFYSILNGYALDDFKLGAASARAQAVSGAELRRAWFLLRSIAVADGRPSEFLAYRDSQLVSRAVETQEIGRLELGRGPIYLGLVEPGYDSAASALAEQLAANVNRPGASYVDRCFLELWRVHVGDTATTRESIGRLRAFATSEGPVRFGVCPLLLEAQIQQMAGPRSAALQLERLDSLIRGGPGDEGPRLSASLGNLLLAMLWEQSGDRERALEALRRRSYWSNTLLTRIFPAYLREEGRLAALLGDTVGAIRAYDHYLTIRTNPEASVLPQLDSVRAALARLVSERGQR